MISQPTIVNVIQALSRCRDYPAILAGIRSHARRLIGADGVTFVLIDNADCHYLEEDAISPLWKGQRSRRLLYRRVGGEEPHPGRNRGRLCRPVTDTGTGMLPEVKGRLFEPFFTTKTVGKGTGIGLGIVADVVARHGGTIRLESEPGSGTSFHVTFPIAESAAH